MLLGWLVDGRLGIGRRGLDTAGAVQSWALLCAESVVVSY